jgi:hypothetical protein
MNRHLRVVHLSQVSDLSGRRAALISAPMGNAPERSSAPQKGRKTLDDLRRERGEGWQWARAQTDRCPQCGQHPGAMERDALGSELLESAAAWRTFLLSADDAYLRRVPGPGIFSPIRYGAHVRDIQHAYADRILLMLEDDNPVFPQLNPDEAAWNGYNRLGPEELADDIEAQARRLASILDTLQPGLVTHHDQGSGKRRCVRVHRRWPGQLRRARVTSSSARRQRDAEACDLPGRDHRK